MSALAAGTAVPVSEATDRLDRRLVRVGPAELAAQPEYGELDPFLADAGRVVPRLGQQLIWRQDRAGVPYQGVEQAELGRGETLLVTLDVDPPLGRVEVDQPVVVDMAGPAVLPAGGAAQQRLDPGE